MKGLRDLMAPIEGRVRGMLVRAIVNLVDDARQVQEMQLELLDDERQDAVEHFQNYGFTSRPKPGAEAIAACVGGLRSHMIALVVDDRRFRLVNLLEGEVALYDDLGNVVKLGRERIEIVAASAVAITAPDGVSIDGDVTVTGTVTASEDVVAGGISLKTHTHGGVQTGSGNTGAPA